MDGVSRLRRCQEGRESHQSEADSDTDPTTLVNRSQLYGAWTCRETSHRQNNAEFCFAAHHARVSLARLFERVCLDHRAHARKFSEIQCVPFSGWCTRSRALNILSSNNELYRRDLNGIRCNADHYELTVWRQTVDQFGHSF